jgi:ATP adenylyltransferase
MTLHDRTFKSRSSNNLDPFDRSALNPSHVVTPISPMHTLILNKFYTIKDHTIVITNSFERQESLLSQYDFEAWFFCVSSIKAIGFYNSNAIAGASQAHKHMQLIPLNEIRNLSPDATYTLPVDIVIRTKIVTKEWNFFLPFGTTNEYLNGLHGNFHQGSAIPEEYLDASQSNFYQIPQYHFKHAVVALIEAEDWAEISDKISYSEYLVATYRWLLTEVNLLPSITSKAAIAYGSYNLLLTDRWMMVVCRQRESLRVTGDDFNDIDVTSINGLGFSGMLLARGPTALSIIKDMTPLSVLQAVSLPLVSD